MNLIFYILIYSCTTDNACTWKEFAKVPTKHECIEERHRLRKEFGIKSICDGRERR